MSQEEEPRKKARTRYRSPRKRKKTGPRTPEDGSKEIESTTSERDTNASTDYRTDEIIRGRERVQSSIFIYTRLISIVIILGPDRIHIGYRGVGSCYECLFCC